jgi:hypothetical protein
MIRAAVAAAVAASFLTVVAHAAAPPAQVDVSRAKGIQAEVAITVDPRDSRILLAGSNDTHGAATRTYDSSNAGKTWRSVRGPAGFCGGSDPTVGIDRNGRQYYGWLDYVCNGRGVRLIVASRPSPAAAWSNVTVASDFVDKPALAVDTNPASPHVNRIYVAWSVLTLQGEIDIASSDDGGATWSAPVEVTPNYGTFASIATGADGSVYVAWIDYRLHQLLVRGSSDGGATFGATAVVGATWATDRRCGQSGRPIPADPVRCLTANPTALVDTTARVHVVYAAPSGALLEVRDVSFAPDLSAPVSRPVHPSTGRADRFLPTATVDALTGVIWACYYDTTGDPRRQSATFTCTSSSDGGATWAPPRRVASVASNVTTKLASEFGWGDYEGVAALAGTAHPIWTDTRQLRRYKEEIYTASLQ